MTRTRLATLAILSLATATAAVGTAHAQSLPGGGGGGIASGGFQPPVRGGGAVPPPLPAPPPALPGAARHEAAAPATKPALDMQPNDALFDAINRGDMATARDALSRGADINGHNVLGMTPLELSVDLGRNDITFLLLSLRGSAAPESPPGGAAVAANGPATAGVGKHVGAPAHPREPARLSAEVRATRPAPNAASALAPASVRYAGSSPGTAIPQAGFLGF